MPWKCPVCGAENPDDADRCLSCGAPRPQEAVEGAEGAAVEAEAQEAPAQAGAEGESEAAAGEAVEEAQPRVQLKAEAPEEEVEAVEPVPEGARVYFKVINSPARELQGSTVPLNFDVFGKITLGRSEENVIITPDPSVSRKHAVVYLDEARRLVIEDLGSTNGTFVYKRDSGTFAKVDKAYLKNGDIIRLGEATVFQVVIEKPEA